MIKSVTVTNYLGETLKLELTRPDLSGFVVKSITGLGPGKADINTVDISTNDGSLYNSSRITKRNIVMKLQFHESYNESIEDIRHKSYKYFPLKKYVTLLIETDRRLAKTVGYVEENEPDIFSEKEGCNISIICPDPLFYAAGENERIETIFSGIHPNFEFPFSNESLTEELIEFGIIENKKEKVVVYNGDSEVGIEIVIHAIGEASNITIYNTLTREQMFIDTSKLEKLTGSGIVAGDTITINTSDGQKSLTLLRDGKQINILNCFRRNSKWFKLSKGDNIFAYQAETGSANLQFVIVHKVVYYGV